LTYSRLNPGRHSYTLSKDGYQTANGTVDLTADKTTTLSVTLQPATAQQKTAHYREQDYYQSALAAIDRGDFETAVNDLTEAVTLSPSYADAYVKRAEAQLRLSNRTSAYDDYLRAAEIFQFKNNYNQASVAYQNALDLNDKSIPAYLGRGTLYLARNEALAAVADFDMVIRLDKRNVDGYIGLGRARYNQGYFDKAVKHFKDARSIESDNPVIYQYLMLSYFGAGEFKEVRKAYDRFLKCASDDQVQQMQADSRFAPVFRILE
jgi:tetratricopeptide (TPR) repeat protein